MHWGMHWGLIWVKLQGSSLEAPASLFRTRLSLSQAFW